MSLRKFCCVTMRVVSHRSERKQPCQPRSEYLEREAFQGCVPLCHAPSAVELIRRRPPHACLDRNAALTPGGRVKRWAVAWW